jgi:hypothetical protein
MLLGSSDRSVFSSDTPKLYEKSIFQFKKKQKKNKKRATHLSLSITQFSADVIIVLYIKFGSF